MRVYNMESSRTGRPVANQFVIVDDDANKMTFQSYDSMIVEIDWQNSIVTFGKDWNYSVTTSKYRNEFLFSCHKCHLITNRYYKRLFRRR